MMVIFIVIIKNDYCTILLQYIPQMMGSLFYENMIHVSYLLINTNWFLIKVQCCGINTYVHYNELHEQSFSM